MAKVGRIVTHIELNASEALKSIKSYQGQMGYLDKSLRAVEKSEKEYGKTLTTTSTRLSLTEKNLEATNKAYGETTKRLDELTRKQESGVKMTKAEERELSKLSTTLVKLETKRGVLENNYVGLTKNMEILTEAAKNQGRSLEDIQREYDETGNKMREYQTLQESGTKLTEEQEREYKDLVNTMGALDINLKDVQSSMGNYATTAKTNTQHTKTWKEQVKDLKGNLKDLKGNLSDVGDGLKTIAAPAIALGGAGFKSFLDQEAVDLEVTRFIKESATDQQRAFIETAMQDVFRSRPEDNEVLAELMAEVLKKLDPSEYEKVFTKAVKDIANFSITTSLSEQEAAQLIGTWMTVLPDMGWGKVSGATSAINAMENTYSIDAGSLAKVATTILPSANMMGISIDEIIALSGGALRLSTRGEDAVTTGLNKQLQLLTDAKVINPTTPAEYDKDGNETKAFNDGITDLQRDLMGFTGIGRDGQVKDLVNLIDKDPVSVFVDMLKGLKAEASMNNQDVVTWLSQKDYLSNEVNAREVLSNLITQIDSLDEYLDVTSGGYASGTGVDEEAQPILELTSNKLKLFWKDLQAELVVLGESLGPHIIELIKQLEPYIDYIGSAAEWISLQDPETIAGIVKWLGEMFVLGKGIGAFWKIGSGVVGAGVNVGKFTIGLGKLLGIISKGSEVVVGADGIAVTTSAVGKLTAAISAKGGLSAALIAATPLLLGLAGAVAGLAVAEHYLNKLEEKQRNSRIYGQLNERNREVLRSDIDPGRPGLTKLSLSDQFNVDVQLTKSDIRGIQETFDNMTETITKELANQISGVEFKPTGNTEADAYLQSLSNSGSEQAQVYQNRTDEIKSEISTLMDQLNSGEVEFTDAINKRINALYDEISRIQAQSMSDDRKTQGQIATATKNNIDVAAIETRDEAQELINTLGEMRETIRGEYEDSTKILRDALKTETDTDKRKIIQDQLNKLKEDFETSDIGLITKINEIFNSRSIGERAHIRLWGSAKETYYDAQNQTYMTKEQSGDLASVVSDLDRLSNVDLRLVNSEDLDFAQDFIGYIDRMRNDPIELLDRGVDSGFDLIMQLIKEDGIGYLYKFQQAFGHLVPEDYFTDFAIQIKDSFKEIGKLVDDMTMEEKQMVVWSNFDTTITDFITMKDLWYNEEFITKMAEMDIINAQRDIETLLVEIGGVPRDIVTQFLADNNDIFNKVKQTNRELSKIPLRVVTQHVLEQQRRITNAALTGDLRDVFSTNISQRVANRARGDKAFKGGLAAIGDGGRSEPVLLPDGSMFLSPSTTTYVNLPPQTEIFPSIAHLMRDIVPHFASGVGNSKVPVTVADSGQNNNINISVDATVFPDGFEQRLTEHTKKFLEREQRKQLRTLKNKGVL